MEKMIQQLKYMILIFSICFVVFGVQASQYSDELGEYILSEEKKTCDKKITATYQGYNLIMIQRERTCNKQRKVILNGKTVAKKTEKTCKLKEFGQVSNWNVFPFKMSSNFVSQLKLQANFSNNSNQQLLQQQNSNNQQPVIIKQQQEPSNVGLENKKAKMAKIETINNKVLNNIGRNRSDHISSFKDVPGKISQKIMVKEKDCSKEKQKDTEKWKVLEITIVSEKKDDDDFLFVQLQQKEKPRFIDGFIHVGWFAWLIASAVRQCNAEDIIRSVGCTRSLNDVKIFRKYFTDKFNTNDFLVKLKECKTKHDGTTIDIWCSPKNDDEEGSLYYNNLLYLVANNIVHLKCDKDYNLQTDSEYEYLLTHCQYLRDSENSGYIFLLAIERDNKFIQCFVNKKKDGNIEFVVDYDINDEKFRSFLKNLFVKDDQKRNAFLGKQISNLLSQEGINQQCHKEILEKLGIEKELIEKVKKPEEKIEMNPPVVVNRVVIQPPNQSHVTGWKILDIVSLAWKYPKSAACIGIPIMLWVTSLVKKGASELLVCCIVGVLCLGKLIADKKI